jgi:glycosyltransferase involved in cell wall biosynthesis
MAHSPGDALRILFIKHALAYPRATGHDIRCFEMLRAFHRLGHQVALATVGPSANQALEEIGIPCFTLQHTSADGKYAKTALGYWQERFRTFWGISEEVIRAVPRVADEFEADVVVGLGLDILSHLANAGNRVRVWYAADEFIVHHLSQVKLSDPRTYSSLPDAAIMGLYERSFASALDRVWVVSAAEQRPMRNLAGMRNVDVIANGVDTEYFAPSPLPSVANSAVFWGRLDFGPNIQALDWFCDRIWPEVRRRVPTGVLTVMGFSAGAQVRALADLPGIRLVCDAPDIRSIVAENRIAILPMISGGGIKNKLLEAAAMGKAIVCTSRALGGLRSTPPAVIVDGENEWVESLVRLWESDDERHSLEKTARSWILEHHTWEAAARDALRGLDGSLAGVDRAPKPVPTQTSSASPISRRSNRDHRILFVKRSLAFPRVTGHDVHGFELLRALQQAGCKTALATIRQPSQQSLEQLNADWYPLADGTDNQPPVRLSRWQERFRSYWGVSHETIHAVAAAGNKFDASVVVGIGLDVLPYLAGVGPREKIWYAADEWVLHHLSQIRPTQPATYGELRSAMLRGAYERAYASSIDRAWVVSETERRAMRLLAGIKRVDVIPNGVDFDYFSRPSGIRQTPNSAVFWGRLDFVPNVQGLVWFCDHVWPHLLRQVPAARFTIMGFNAVGTVRELARRPGIQLLTDVPDIRPTAAEAEVVVLPLISRGGIKNKLLEAAAMASTIVCTTNACSGLRTTPPAVIVDRDREFVDAILKLWRTPAERQRLGAETRAWAVAHHSWRAAAEDALTALEQR